MVAMQAMTLSTEQHEFRRVVRQFAEDKIAPLAAETDAKAEYSWEAFEALKAMELTALSYPEEYGGSGASTVDQAIVCEELARVCASTALMFLISKLATIHAAIVGAPAPIWFLGMQRPGAGFPDLSELKADAAVAAANIAPIRTPILILVGSADGLLPLATSLHAALVQGGKSVEMDVYEHGYHDFVLGPQGQKRPDLARGEILLQGALDALEKSVAFLKQPAQR